MGEEILEQSGSNDVTDASSAESSGSESGTDNNEKASSGTETKQEQYVPYDRFKELVEQKNQFSKKFEETDRSLRALQERLEKSSKPAEVTKENALISRLKGIDPEFGTWAEQQEAARAELAELREWKAQQAAERNRSEVQSSLSRLHTEYKIADSDKGLYNAMIKDIATSNPNLSPQDLPTVFRQVHDQLSKMFETRERAALSKYTTAKKADSSVPTAAKGAAPKASGKFEYSKDPEEARAQLVKRSLEQLRASKNI